MIFLRFTSISIVLVLFSANIYAASFYGLFGDLRTESSQDDNDVAGTLDFYLAHSFSERNTGLIEYVIDNSDGQTTQHAERFSLQHKFSNKFNLAIGRFHTPLGDINRTKHHGTILQETVSRPFFLEYHTATTILPLHVAGLMATGVFSKDSINFGYEATIHSDQNITQAMHGAHGDHITIDPNDSFAGAIKPGYSLRLRAFPNNRLWNLGTFIYQTNTGFNLSNTDYMLDQNIIGMDLMYDSEPWKISAESFYLTHHYKGLPETSRAKANFVQLLYKYDEKLSLSLRKSVLQVDSSDNYFKFFNINNQHRLTYSLRYQLDDNNSLKFEIENIKDSNPAIGDTNLIRTQWSFLFF